MFKKRCCAEWFWRLEFLKLVIVWFLLLDQLIILQLGWVSLRDPDSELWD